MLSEKESKTMFEVMADTVQDMVKEERKRILEGIMAIDRTAGGHFEFSMAVKSWICQEFKEEMKELKK